MPTVLDSFVLEFNLDHKQFDRGQNEVFDILRKTKDQAERLGTEVEAGQKRVNDLMASFRREAITTLGLFLGGRGIKDFIEYVTSLDAATGRLAKTMGMATEETSAWQGAIKQSGGTAEGANAALAGLSGEMTRFTLTGQSAMLPVLTRLGVSLYDQNHKLKTSGQLWLDLSEAVQGMDAREATAFLQMIPGANQDMINFALLGRRAMEQYIEEQKRAGVTTAESAEAAREYQKQIALLDSSATALGRTFVTLVAPAITAAADSLQRLLQSWNTKEGSAEDIERSAGQRGKLVDKFGSPGDIMRWLATPTDGSQAWGFDAWMLRKADEWYGPEGADVAQAANIAAAGRSRAGQLRGSEATAAAGPNDVEAYIRAQAAARGINPDVAVGVARSEGMREYVGDQGSSFGPYQLHYGGVAGGGNAVSGLGDIFTKKTGLDARDQSTWQKQVDFSLDWAKTHGWSDWHGWKGAAFAGIGPGGGGAGGRSVTVQVGGVTVNDHSGNADSIANNIGGALERSIRAGAANYGAQ